MTMPICKHFTPSNTRVGAEYSNDWPFAERVRDDACAKLTTKGGVQPCAFQIGDHSACNVFEADKTAIAESDNERLVLLRDNTLKFKYVVEDSRGDTVRSMIETDEDSAVAAFSASTRGQISRSETVAPKRSSYILNVVGAS